MVITCRRFGVTSAFGYITMDLRPDKNPTKSRAMEM
jgi:hypothetical protein